MAYSYPKTKEEYWNAVDAHWADIYNILVRFVPKEKLVEADHLRLTKDSDIVHLFNDAWWNAPDSPSIHYIPGWNVLCDLCSESYLIHEESEEE
jgi:hypothetical protein